MLPVLPSRMVGPQIGKCADFEIAERNRRSMRNTTVEFTKASSIRKRRWPQRVNVACGKEDHELGYSGTMRKCNELNYFLAHGCGISKGHHSSKNINCLRRYSSEWLHVFNFINDLTFRKMIRRVCKLQALQRFIDQTLRPVCSDQSDVPRLCVCKLQVLQRCLHILSAN